MISFETLLDIICTESIETDGEILDKPENKSLPPINYSLELIEVNNKLLWVE